jgi:hypothetical protein
LNLKIAWELDNNRDKDKDMSTKTKEQLSNICNQILDSDSSIRFVGIPNKMGKQIISRYRNGLVPLVTENEIEMFAIEAVLRMNTRKEFESKLGKAIYSFTLYEKVKRVTITLESKEYPIIMLSFDIQSDHEYIILDKILPIIRREGL